MSLLKRYLPALAQSAGRLVLSLCRALRHVSGGRAEVVEKNHLREAFDRAVARPGSVMLLSPACSSFDDSGHNRVVVSLNSWVQDLYQKRGR